jgi:myo-inositol 2-dehydrogenase/D-chiro-inositol 1-dehydrogenase
MTFAKIGFVGCGTHSTNNIYPMLKYARCRLDATCDLDERLAKRNADLFGAQAHFTDPIKMFEQRQLDGVMIVGPEQVHYQVGMAALERSIPVFVEKPTAPSLAMAREMTALAAKKGVFVMTGFMKRHGMAYSKIASMIQSGQFVPAAGCFQYGHWHSSDLRSMLFGMSIHPIDLAIHLFGDVASVHSSLYRSASQAISLGVTLRFKNARWAQLMLDSSQPRIQERVQISGTLGDSNALFIVDNVERLELHKGGGGIDVLAELHDIRPQLDLDNIQVWRPDNGLPNMGQTRHFFQGFAGEVREFVDAILDKRTPLASGEESLRALQVAEAILNNPDGVTHF